MQSERSRKLVEISTQSAEAAKQTVSGAGEVVNIATHLKELSAALTAQVSQFKIQQQADEASHRQTFHSQPGDRRKAG